MEWRTRPRTWQPDGREPARGLQPAGQPFTDDQGNTILQAQDEEGNTAIVRRGTDDVGNLIDSIFDAQGNLWTRTS